MKQQKISSFLYSQRQGFSLMMGVFFAFGIGFYFALPVEPALWGVGLLAFVSSVLWFLGRRDSIARLVLGYICLFCLGLCIATVRTCVVTAPILSEKLSDAFVSGVVSKVENQRDGYRVTLKDVQIEGIEKDQTPVKIRLNYKSKDTLIRVGDTLKGYAYLIPPMGPAENGAYDFSRAAYFMQLGAVGRLTELTEYYVNSNRFQIDIWLEDIRSFISERVREVLPDDTAAIVIPLIIGDQGLVSSKQYELYRIAGIVHVLSVSGFHLTLLAGLVFLLIRGIFALFPCIGGIINTKKLAAFLSLLLVLFYLFISGLQIPAIRSFIMIAVILVAVIFDRQAISLRTAVLAGVIILAIWPESLFNAGFQLSFMAVFAMLSLYETLMYIFKNSPYRYQLWYKFWLIFIGSVCISVLATLSTALYGVYHFNQLAPYGVLGNLLTNALFSFAIMPLLLMSVLMMPFGLDALFLRMSGYCLDVITYICEWIRTLPYADVTVPSFETWGLVVATIGLLTLFFFQGYIRLWGIPIIMIGFVAFYTVSRPDILVSEDGKVVAVRMLDGRLALTDVDANPFVSDVWLKRNGQNSRSENIPIVSDKFVIIRGKKIAFSSLACADADLSFLLKYEIGDCPEPVIKLKDLWDNKTHAVFVNEHGILVKNMANYTSKRPWHQFLLAQQKK
ncbi:MAG: ComEC/Rec2 family competence protein [Alphaproteobacteria bacterium]|nr:ComEC/Rec2 family competence protein [Alphaproteobacteria bacterium]